MIATGAWRSCWRGCLRLRPVNSADLTISFGIDLCASGQEGSRGLDNALARELSRARCRISSTRTNIGSGLIAAITPPLPHPRPPARIRAMASAGHPSRPLPRRIGRTPRKCPCRHKACRIVAGFKSKSAASREVETSPRSWAGKGISLVIILCPYTIASVA